MKICDNRKQQEWPEVPEKPFLGRVYQKTGGLFKGSLYVGTNYCGDVFLVNLTSGGFYADSGFDGDQPYFRDVTDYVCLDVSRLPPLEDDESTT